MQIFDNLVIYLKLAIFLFFIFYSILPDYKRCFLVFHDVAWNKLILIGLNDWNANKIFYLKTLIEFKALQKKNCHFLLNAHFTAPNDFFDCIYAFDFFLNLNIGFNIVYEELLESFKKYFAV